MHHFRQCFSNYPEGTAISFCLIPNSLQTNTSVKHRKYKLLDVALNIYKHSLLISVLILSRASNSSWFDIGPLTTYTLNSIIHGARKDSGGTHKTAYWLSFARCGLISLPCSSNTILPSAMLHCVISDLPLHMDLKLLLACPEFIPQSSPHLYFPLQFLNKIDHRAHLS